MASDTTVLAAAAAMAIHKNLKGRKGFDHLFDDIDQETLVEMLAEHTEIIEKIYEPALQNTVDSAYKRGYADGGAYGD